MSNYVINIQYTATQPNHLSKGACEPSSINLNKQTNKRTKVINQIIWHGVETVVFDAIHAFQKSSYVKIHHCQFIVLMHQSNSRTFQGARLACPAKWCQRAENQALGTIHNAWPSCQASCCGWLGLRKLLRHHVACRRYENETS